MSATRRALLLAYSLRADAIPILERLRGDRFQDIREDALAAIDAIRHRNHHYFKDRDFKDRDHSGRVRLIVNPEIDGDGH